MAASDTLQARLKELADRGEEPGLRASDDDKGAYSFLRYTAQNDHFQGFYQTWTKAILFVLGRHHIEWLAGPKRFVPDTNVPPWRQQPVTNLTYATLRTLTAKLTKQKPTFEVVPPSRDSDDRESAQLGEALLTHYWRVLKLSTHVKKACAWFLCTGQVYLAPHWDPEAGRIVPLTQLVEQPHPDIDGETVDVECPCDEHGDPIMTTPDDGSEPTYNLDAEPALVPEGDVGFGIEDPMGVRFNPDAESPEAAEEWYVGRLWPRGKACQHFGITPEDLEGGTDEDQEMYRELMSGGASGGGWLANDALWSGSTAAGTSQQEAIGDQVLVLRYYRKPCTRYPKGRHWISIGPKKVWPPRDADHPTGEAPLPYGFWPPFVPVQSQPVPGQPLAIGVIPQAVPLNEQLNELDGKIMEQEIMMAMGGKWVLHPLDEGLEINSDPGQMLVSKGYANNAPPIQTKLTALPAEIYREREIIQQKLHAITATSAAEFSKKPEGVSSGRGFLVLQEEVDATHTPDLEAFEVALEEVGRRILVLAQQYVREERTIQIRGDRGEWEVRSFRGADLADGLDVRVQVGSSFPWSKSAQWDTKLSVIEKFPGLVTKPDGTVDQEKFSRFVDTGATGLDAFETDEDPDLVEVQREIAMFEAYDPATGHNELPQLGWWQSQPVRLEAYARFLKRDRGRFERWSEPAKMAFMEFCREMLTAVDELTQSAVDAEVPPALPAGEPSGQPQLQVIPGTTPRSGAPSKGNPPALQRADFAAAGQ